MRNHSKPTLRILIIISTWFWLVWSLHTDHYEFRPVYEIPDYEDFTLQEDNLPSSLISWLDNNQPNTNAGKRQRFLENDNSRRYSSKFFYNFCRPSVAFLHNAKFAGMYATFRRVPDYLFFKIFLRVCRLTL